VSAVRLALRAAGREPLTGGAGGYRLEAGPDELDLLAFDRHLDEAREHPDRAVPALRAAVELWGGRPLGGISGHARGAFDLSLALGASRRSIWANSA
jgi:hypothetical protein